MWYVTVCVCERERERKREYVHVCVCECVCVYVCVCVCVNMSVCQYACQYREFPQYHRYHTLSPSLSSFDIYHSFSPSLRYLLQVCGIEGEGEDKQQRSQTVRSSATPVFNRKWVSDMLSSRPFFTLSLCAVTLLTFDLAILCVFMYVCVCLFAYCVHVRKHFCRMLSSHPGLPS